MKSANDQKAKRNDPPPTCMACACENPAAVRPDIHAKDVAFQVTADAVRKRALLKASKTATPTARIKHVKVKQVVISDARTSPDFAFVIDIDIVLRCD